MSQRPEHLLLQHRCRTQFLRKLEQFAIELELETARRHLDNLLDHMCDLLSLLDPTDERDRLRARLAVAYQQVACRHNNLRVVK